MGSDKNKPQWIDGMNDLWVSSEDTNKNNGLLDTLNFWNSPRILNDDEIKQLIWGKFWCISQWDYSPADYQTSSYYEINGIDAYDNKLETKCLESEWPYISADKNELAEILKERWYILTHEWRSWFASRNSYVISKSSPQMIPVKTPLIIQCRMGKEDKEKFWILSEESSESRCVLWTGESQEKEMISPSEIQEVQDALEKAKEELRQRRKKKMDEYIKSQKNWYISIVEVWWWPEDFHEYDIPENYIIIAQKRIACTADHRRNMTHTYAAVLIDQDDFAGKSFMKIKVPDGYKWLVIGSGWSNIRSLCEKLKCRIMIE